jgi:glycosyltransferase involved in cell wall biosynthesis
LNELGVDAELVARGSDGRWNGSNRSWKRLPLVAREFDALLLQYNPFMYGSRGFAPWLILDLVRVRSRRRRPTLALYVHETAMPLLGLRKTLMGLWQRVQLRAVCASVDLVFAVIEDWAARLGRFRPRRPALHVPVGSTLPDMRASRDKIRAQLGASDRLVVTTLSSGHESHLLDHTAAAVARIADSEPNLVFLTLGAGAHAVEVPGVDTRRPGELPAADLAALVGASDLMLVPLVDGVSTRRTSVMAALQHGVAVVATRGPLTDSMLDRSDVLALSSGGADSFAEAAVAVAGEPRRRDALASAGRVLYMRAFDWPATARAIKHALESACA